MNIRVSAVRAAAIAVIVAALAVLAAPALAARSHATGAHVTVVETEFKIKLTPVSVAHGSVTFTVMNKGKISHNFKIAGKTTPLIKPGKSATLTISLKAGKAPYQCTVPGHAAAGMKGNLTVR